MKILVGGATGFLGSAIVEQAVAGGLPVRAMGRRASALASDAFVVADITRPITLSSTLAGVTHVIHAAGLAHRFYNEKSDDSFREVNEVGTANIARSAVEAGVSHLVLISSAAVYGRTSIGPRDENTECRPESPYAISKWNAERRAIDITRGTGTKLTILRMVTVYGEGDPGNVARLMRAIDRGHFIWIGRGENKKSLIHRDDAARACLIAAQRPTDAPLSIYNVSAPPRPMRDVVYHLAEALERDVPKWNIPGTPVLRMSAGLARLTGGVRIFAAVHESVRTWLNDDVCDGSKFQRELNFSPAVQLLDGLAREVMWYRESQSSA